MPVARNIAAAPIEGNDGTLSAAEPDGDADDGKTYCFCDGVSYGEMIACDDEDCEKEWVSACSWLCARHTVTDRGARYFVVCSTVPHRLRRAHCRTRRYVVLRSVSREAP